MSTELNLADLSTEALTAMAAMKTAMVEREGAQAVEAAINAGRFLAEIKSRLNHGEWLPWLEKHWPHSPTWVSKMMRLAEFSQRNPLQNAASIRDALKMMAEVPEKQQKPQLTDDRQPEITVGRIIGLIEMMHHCMNDGAVSVSLECLRWARLAARALSSRVGAENAEAAMERAWLNKGRRVCFVLSMLPMDDPTEVSAKFIIETILEGDK
jgi:hypothetical protein